MAMPAVGQSPSAPDKGCNQPPRFCLCASGFILRVVGLVTKPMCFRQLHRFPPPSTFFMDSIWWILFGFSDFFSRLQRSVPTPHSAPIFILFLATLYFLIILFSVCDTGRSIPTQKHHTYPEASYLALESCFLSSSFGFSFMATTGIGTGITRAWEHGKYILAYYNSTHHWVGCHGSTWACFSMFWRHYGLLGIV